MEENLSCSICQELFTDPVVLSCSHSFCNECLKNWWREKPTQECPVCKRRSSRSDPPRNLALRNLCEAFVQQRKLKTSGEQVCEVHSERLKLFCLTDQQPVCVVCRDSAAHRNHSFKPIEEVTKDLKEKLRKYVQPLTKNIEKAKEVKMELCLTLAHIKNQFQHTERQICDQFKKLHQFLVEEEESRLKALREEEQQKTQRMKDRMTALNREIEALSETIRATEKQLRAPDVSFLLKYKATIDRVQDWPLLEEEPQLGPGTLINQAKHLGNLTFNIWTNMKRIVQFTPVILDPNSASSVTVLSESLNSFKAGPEQKLPDLPGRFKLKSPFVGGSEGFDSGSHSWDVQVRNCNDWILGVMTKSGFSVTERDLNLDVHLDTSGYAIGYLGGQYFISAVHKKKDTILKLNYRPSRIRLRLDCSKHSLTFYDGDTNTRLHSIARLDSGELYPFFVNKTTEPITVLPQDI